jgi:hypothetical protein
MAVAQSIANGLAYTVSNGLYKQNWGTSAFLLKGANGEAVPRALEDQSEYRSELSGISGVLAIVNCL